MIVTLDQFPRNMYRGTPNAFGSDAQALAACREGLKLGVDRALHWVERAFFYLPLEHAEDLDTQRQSLRCFESLRDETAGGPFGEYFADTLTYAVKHLEIVERFGRFPHRNRILGRASTPEEEAFLLTPGSSF